MALRAIAELLNVIDFQRDCISVTTLLALEYCMYKQFFVHGYHIPLRNLETSPTAFVKKKRETARLQKWSHQFLFVSKLQAISNCFVGSQYHCRSTLDTLSYPLYHSKLMEPSSKWENTNFIFLF